MSSLSRPSESGVACALRVLSRANRHIDVGQDDSHPVLRPSAVDSIDTGALVDRLAMFGDCSDSVMAGAFCLLRRLDLTEATFPITDRTANHVLIACTLLARKVVEDRPPSNQHLAKVVCLPATHLVELESWLLQALGFAAFVPPAAIATTREQLQRIQRSASRINVNKLRVKGVPLTFATLAAAPEVVYGSEAVGRRSPHLPFRLAIKRSPLSLFHKAPARASSVAPEHTLPVVALPKLPSNRF